MTNRIRFFPAFCLLAASLALAPASGRAEEPGEPVARRAYDLMVINPAIAPYLVSGEASFSGTDVIGGMTTSDRFAGESENFARVVEVHYWIDNYPGAHIDMKVKAWFDPESLDPREAWIDVDFPNGVRMRIEGEFGGGVCQVRGELSFKPGFGGQANRAPEGFEKVSRLPADKRVLVSMPLAVIGSSMFLENGEFENFSLAEFTAQERTIKFQRGTRVERLETSDGLSQLNLYEPNGALSMSWRFDRRGVCQFAMVGTSVACVPRAVQPGDEKPGGPKTWKLGEVDE